MHVLVRSLVSEELIGQEQAGVSSHKGDWVEGEMTEQKNVPARPGAVSLATRSILETCRWPLCSTARYRESRHLQVISEVRLCLLQYCSPLGLTSGVGLVYPPSCGTAGSPQDRFVLPSGMLWPFLKSVSFTLYQYYISI